MKKEKGREREVAWKREEDWREEGEEQRKEN